MNNIEFTLPEPWTSVKEFTMLVEYLNEIEDPRIDRRKLHPLVSILVIYLCACICGREDWGEIVDFAKNRLDFFKKLVPLPHGIPSKDTFSRVIERLHPTVLQRVTNDWRSNIFITSNEGEQIVLDGKKLRASRFGESTQACYLVNAWASQKGYVISQKRVHDKANETSAMSLIIDELDIANSIISIDAIGCQRNLASKIIKKHGDYLFALKTNQQKTYKLVESYFDTLLRLDQPKNDLNYNKTVEKSHGRLETRECYVLPAPKAILLGEKWPGLKSIVMVISQRTLNGKTSLEKRYYLSSLSVDALSFAKKVRNHWSIENSLHWVLDVDFSEDHSRIRSGFSPQNASWMRCLALSLLKNEPSKLSIRRKINFAIDSTDYILKVLLSKGS